MFNKGVFLFLTLAVCSAQGPPCDGGFCSVNEECCADDQGSACCIMQMTMCVQQDSGFPARCCPRWTVGCTAGSVGCCDPAQPWQWEIDSDSTSTASRAIPHQKLQSVDEDEVIPRSSQAGMTVYSLWERGNGKAELFKIEASTGAITDKIVVAGLDDNLFGLTMREFVFDAKRKNFYYLDANFTANKGVRPAVGRDMYLYTVDAETGKTTKQTVSGAKDYPTGQSLGSSGNLMIATEGYDSSGNNTMINYYSLNPETAQATLLASLARGAGEDSAAFYAGYHRETSDDETTFYRLGYEYVTSQSKQGLGAVTLQGKQASATWTYKVATGHDYYMSMDRVSSDSFLSLAPSLNDTARGLDVVQWNLNNQNITIVATLGNAHPPSVIQLGDLGYLGSYINDQSYVAMVVQNSKAWEFDEWTLASVDLSTGKSSVVPLKPYLSAGGNSLAGLGLA